jgi:sn-glycerol 3-phosphate transport system substrate-binding protein
MHMSDLDRKLSRRSFVRLAAGVLGAGALAACGATPTATPVPTATKPPAAAPTAAPAAPTAAPAAPTATKAPAAPTAVPAAPGKKVEINHWHNWAAPVDQNYLNFVKKYNDANPAVEVKPLFVGNMATTLQKVTAAVAAGAPPQLANGFAAYVTDFADSGVILAAQDALFDTGLVKTDDLFPLIRDTLSYKGKIWAIPVGNVPSLLYYNKGLFAKAGVAKAPTTWEELAEAAKKCTVMKDGKVEQWGIVVTASEPFFLNFHLQNGGQYFSADLKKILINSAAGEETLQYLTDFVLKDKTASPDLASGENPFLAGLLAIQYSTSTGIMRYKAAKLDFGAMRVPSRKEKKGLVTPNVWYAFKNIKPEEATATWNYVKWFLSPEVHGEWMPQIGHCPVFKSAVNTKPVLDYLKEYPEFQLALDELPIGTGAPPVKNYSQIVTALTKRMEEALRAKSSVKEALAALEKDANALLA